MAETDGDDAEHPDAGEDSGEVELPEGCLANFPERRLDYVAGHPDRFLFGRYFQSILIFHSLKAKGADAQAKSVQAPDGAQKYVADFEAAVSRLFDEKDSKFLSAAKTVVALQASGLISAQPPSPAPGKQLGKQPVTPPLIVSPVPIADLLGKVGIVFYDRLRFRNIGTTLGEHITTLALAPGEEVSFTQRSETVRRVGLEEELTRETEREYRLSSTWSTDWTAQEARTSNFNVGGNLGANAQLKVPEIDFLSVGAQAGGDIGYSESNTRSTQLDYTYQLVQDIGRRMREEHRTLVSVSREQTDGFETVRRVVNDNPLRSLMLRFFKLYNKERVTLERYEAKLALNICLVNPLIGLFQDLEHQIDRVDPANPANYNCTPPAAPVTETRHITIEFEDPNDPVSYTSYYHIGATTATPPNSGLVFSFYETPELIEWEIKENDSGATRTANVDQYYEFGGSIETGVTGPAEMNVPATREFWIKAWNAKSFLGGPGIPKTWWTRRLRFAVRLHFVPNPESDIAYQQCIESERLRLLQELSAERLDAMIASALAPMNEHIYRKVIQSTFMEHFSSLGDSLADFLIKEFRHYFDWNEAVIQTMPSWLTGQEDSYYQYIRTKLSNVLPGYDPGRVLPRHLFASGVQVILPVRPGSEEEVLTLLTDDTVAVDAFVEEFCAYRRAHYGDIDRPLPDYADILAPRCDVATPDCADEWDNDWEKPRRKFDVLGAWAEYTPTDGVHLEPRLSVCASGDEARLTEIVTQSEYRLAVRDLALGIEPARRTDAGDNE